MLPTDNSDQTTVGVFFRDTSASKIDYYMDSSVTLGEVCDAGQSTFTASATLHLNIDQAAADALPAYVKSFAWGATKFRTEVFVYGPPGTTFADASVEGAAVKPFNTDVTDLGRPVAAFETYLAPGATATEFWETAGVPLEHLPAGIVMRAEDMVDAALAGFDQGELVTIPALPDVADWDAYEAARQKLIPNLSKQTAATRYQGA